MRRIFPLLLVSCLGFLYLSSIAPDYTWAHFSADSGDLISALISGGVPHPGGYPLYLIIGRAFQFLPVGSLAFRTHLLSSVSTILAALFLFYYLHKNLPESRTKGFSAFFSAMAYGVAPFVWSQALVSEVYALHSFILMLCLCMLCIDLTPRHEWMRGLAFGIAVTNHLTALMLLPLLVIENTGKVISFPFIVLKRGMGFLAGLSLYLLLPLRAALEPTINWGNAATLDGFMWLVSGRLYQPYLFSLSNADVLLRLRASAGLLLNQYTWLGALLGIYGLSACLPRRILIPTLWLAGVYLSFSIFFGSFDSQVNLLPVWLVLAIWIAFGLQDILDIFNPSSQTRLATIAALLLLSALTLRTALVFPTVDLSGENQAVSFLQQAADEIPPRALVFVQGDENIFSLWYLQVALARRVDMALIVEEFLPLDWYLNMLKQNYPFLIIPDNRPLSSAGLISANPLHKICQVTRSRVITCK